MSWGITDQESKTITVSLCGGVDMLGPPHTLRHMVCFGGVGLYLESEGSDDDGDAVGGERDGD